MCEFHIYIFFRFEFDFDSGGGTGCTRMCIIWCTMHGYTTYIPCCMRICAICSICRMRVYVRVSRLKEVGLYHSSCIFLSFRFRFQLLCPFHLSSIAYLLLYSLLQQKWERKWESCVKLTHMREECEWKNCVFWLLYLFVFYIPFFYFIIF